MHAVEVIVIGGSAGALDVMLSVLPALPESCVVPIALVLHLSPTQPSLVPQLLGRACRRPVVEAEDKQPLRPGAIHVAPPNYHMLLERGGSIALSIDEPVQFSRPSIDVLFESAAAAFGAAVAGVVLSGANEDGSAGLRMIVERGGIAIAQAPGSARFPSMPEAAAHRAGRATHVVDPAELAAFLGRLGRAGRAGEDLAP